MILFVIVAAVIFIGCLLGFTILWTSILFVADQFIGVGEALGMPIIIFALISSVFIYYIISTSYILKLRPRVKRSLVWIIASFPPVLAFAVGVYILENLRFGF